MSRLDKGTISNCLSFALLLLGLWLTTQDQPAASWVLAAGLFGFAGGVTNWLAVKMLFDRVPLLYGSGVIPARFRQIRATVKELIMFHFFDEDYLRRFFAEGFGDSMGPDAERLQENLTEMLESEEVDQAISAKLEDLQGSQVGPMIQLAGPDFIKKVLKEFLTDLLPALGPRLGRAVGEGIDVAALRRQVDRLLSAKLEELTPQKVKEMMEQVIREHLGWLIVWGNVFGGGIGLLAHALGY
jgi:uncharacterized membrane protein YheB (UPF0754 family)